MLEKIIKGYCHMNDDCTFIPDYKGDIAIQFNGEHAGYTMILFFTYMNTMGIYDLLEVILDMKIDKLDDNKGIIVYFKVDDSMSKESLIEDSRMKMAAWILENTDFDNWCEQSIAKITKLCLEYLALDSSLMSCAENAEIEDEILSIINPTDD